MALEHKKVFVERGSTFDQFTKGRVAYGVAGPGTTTANPMRVNTAGSLDTLNTGSGNAPGSVVLSGTSVEIIPANTNRKWAYITNNSSRLAFLAIGTAASVDVGLRLAGGAILTIDSTNHTTDAINGIQDNLNVDIAFQEGE